MRRLAVSAASILVGVALLVCALSAFPGWASAEPLAQPSPRPPLPSETPTSGGGQPPPPPAPTETPVAAQPTFVLPTATLVHTRTPTSSPTPTATLVATDTPTVIPSSVYQTATSEAATAQAATVEAIVALTAAALQPPTSAAPTSAPPTVVVITVVSPTTQPASASQPDPLGAWLWVVLLIPLVLLAIALLWLVRRDFLLPGFYPWRGRPRWIALKRGRRAARRRDFPF